MKLYNKQKCLCMRQGEYTFHVTIFVLCVSPGTHHHSSLWELEFHLI